MARAKICGVTTAADLEAVAAAGADAAGLLVDVPVDSPREITPDRAATLVEAAPPFLTTVLVTMPETVADALALVERVEPDAIQVHGGLGPGAVADLAASVAGDVLFAVDADDVDDARRYDDVVDALVVDSVDDAGGGGTGETHDWERTREATATLTSPVVLAGGLHPDTVADAVRTVEPYAVDVASGVERTGGEKDPDAVCRFVDRARNARRTAEP